MLRLINSVVFIGLSGRKELLLNINAQLLSFWLKFIVQWLSKCHEEKKIVKINEDLSYQKKNWGHEYSLFREVDRQLGHKVKRRKLIKRLKILFFIIFFFFALQTRQF